MKKNQYLFVLVALLCASLLAGCGGGEPTAVATQEPETTPPAVPTVAIGEVVDQTIRLDPATVEDADSLALSSYLYSGLTMLDGDGNVQPALATSWIVSDDQLDYIVELQQGVSFQSGTIFNADVVLANFNRWFDPEDPLHGTGTYTGWVNNFLGFKGEADENMLPLSPYDGIEKSGEYTVIIHLNRPVPDLLEILASAGDTYGASAETISGTGAYTVTSWTDEGLVLSPNASYWGEVPADELHFGWR
jgi:peptide/nickel transport system substrate-binding protein